MGKLNIFRSFFAKNVKENVEVKQNGFLTHCIFHTINRGRLIPKTTPL